MCKCMGSWIVIHCYLWFNDSTTTKSIQNRLYDILCDLFAEQMPEDKQHQYRPDTVNVYYENRVQGKLHKIDVMKTIKQITMDPE